MPVKRDDAEAALAILNRLQTQSEKDSPVALAASRVANIFQSRLYNALLDIQDYYELHLNNKEIPQKDPEFDTFRIYLEKTDSGLGFSITGGIDSPVDTGDIHIYISKIIQGGAAEQQGQLRPGDAVLAINNIDCRTVTHGTCVEQLQSSSENILASSTSTINEATTELITVKLQKNKSGLGFSIAGGVGNQHIEGNDGIFITKIIPGGAAAQEGRLLAGDRIMFVDNNSLARVSHEQAVAFLTNSGSTVLIKLIRENPVQVESSDDHVLPSATSSSISLTENLASSKGNILDVSRISDFGIPAGSAADSAIKHGCAVYDGTQGRNHAPRTVILKRGKSGFGFNIVGGEAEIDPDWNDSPPGIFVSFVLAGGPADSSKSLQKGDRILTVNSNNIEYATHQEAALILRNSGDTVELLVQHEVDSPILKLENNVFLKPENFAKFEERMHDLRQQMLSASIGGGLQTSSKKEMTVRALFDYTALRDSGLPSKGLSFRFGDIIHVTNASDKEWWQANLMGKPADQGCIPSKARVERKEKLRMKQVKFRRPGQPNGEARKSRGRLNVRVNAISSKLNLMKSKENICSNEANNSSSDDEFEMGDDWVLSYEPVKQVEIELPRPIVIFGPSKEKMSDELIKIDPTKYQQAIPHTTRPKRNCEVEGRDYYFISKTEMTSQIENREFIEAGQFSENLYGTSVKAVTDVAKTGKHCILDVSGGALRRLSDAQLPAIAIYIKPRSVESLMESNKRLSEAAALQIIQQCQRLEADFAEQFTAVIQAEDGEEHVRAQVLEIVESLSGTSHWLPTGDKI
ncbi:unnamed protein product [Oikopleura dioica]|uniref:Uncharacterized protein n=1 Tax=Oikopleura dioica TaxID=34765 RepID=E4YDS9_OIKDI|nr:unnamed protein product [Oikopleura dioica]